MRVIVVNPIEGEADLRREFLAACADLRKAKRTGQGYPEARERALAAERAYAPLFWASQPIQLW